MPRKTSTTKKQTRSQKRREKNQGMNWIRPEKRLAIYLRDGLACCYCPATVEDSVLTLDHITPLSRRGTNKETNLVTACLRCNSSRGNRKLATFVAAVAKYLNHGVTAKQINDHIQVVRFTKLDITLAKAIFKRRGSFSAALRTAAKQER